MLTRILVLLSQRDQEMCLNVPSHPLQLAAMFVQVGLGTRLEHYSHTVYCATSYDSVGPCVFTVFCTRCVLIEYCV